MQKKIFNIYLFLLIFNMINREFVMFIDLRYIVLILASILLIFGLKRIIKKEVTIANKDIFVVILFLFIVCLFSNINLVNFDSKLVKKEFFNLLILYAYNFVNIINIYIYSKDIETNKIIKFFKYSIIFLSFSMIYAFVFKELPFCNYTGITTGLEHYNVFGLKFRLAGYALDPNYVTLISFVFMALLYFHNKNDKKNYIYYIISIILICFSFSKTIMLTILPIIIICYIFNKIKNKKLYNVFCVLLILSIVCLPIIAYSFRILGETSTMMNRYLLWKHSFELFFDKPLIGNGLSSFRIYMLLSKDWFVQCHSTIFQLLAEHGIISLILFCVLSYQILQRKSKYINFTFLIYLFFAITYETMYLSFIILFFAINLHLKEKDKIKKEKVSVFVINSFQNGGAERVVINQANELVKQGHKVLFILFRDRIEYDLNPKFEIIKLTNKQTFSRIEKICLLPKLIFKLNCAYDEIQNNYEIELLTTHLPLPHFICRLSKIRNKILYVLHNPHFQFKFSKKRWFKMLLRFMYNNKKLVAVSNGVSNELLNDFNVKTKYITTIYNPINIDDIEKKIKLKNTVDVKDKYILFCGRLTSQKRPDRMIDVFYEGNLYKKYKLVFIGIGELEDEVKEQIKKYNLQDSVILKGWQKNAYQWMRKAQLLVCTSDYESFGMILAEALCCGTPVVSVNCDFGPDEILIDDLSKYLCTIEIKDIINKIELALKNYPKDLKKYVSKFNVQNNINSYLKFYDKSNN